MNQILSRVSPQRQQSALDILQKRRDAIIKNQSEQQRISRLKKFGIDPDQPEEAIKEQIKSKEAKRRLSDLSGGQPSQDGEIPLTTNQDQNVDQGLISLTDDQLVVASSDPSFGRAAIQELQRRQADKKANLADIRERRKEVAPFIKKISDDADLAREGIANKERLLEKVETGNINDPTFANAMTLIPGNFGERFLSTDTITYRSGLIDEFKDLRKVFQGQTRVKEIELLEKKIPDIYLTNEQKKGILKERIGILGLDILKEQAAEEIDEEFGDKGLSLLKYKKLVNERYAELAKSKADQFIDNVSKIISDAEKNNERPLSRSNPEDVQILQSILDEAGGDEKKALKLMKARGFSFGGK